MKLTVKIGNDDELTIKLPKYLCTNFKKPKYPPKPLKNLALSGWDDPESDRLNLRKIESQTELFAKPLADEQSGKREKLIIDKK